jgi:putative Holliday junction resolvase
MRFLCIDLGNKRTGLAVCDDNETIASPVGVIESGKSLYDEITGAVERYQAQALVFGLPLNMDGSENERTVQTRRFAEEIKDKTNLPIFFQDERLSSFAARKKLSQTGLTHKKKKDRIDAIAAADILREFIAVRKKEK